MKKKKKIQSKMCINKNGTKYWYNEKDQLHRLDGPAIECEGGSKLWYKNGKQHREDGPAEEWSNGYKYWYLNGKEYTEKEFNYKKSIIVKLTLDEVIERLGYPIKIVKKH